MRLVTLLLHPTPLLLLVRILFIFVQRNLWWLDLLLWLVSNSFLLAHLASVEVNPIYQGLLKWVLSVDWRLVLQPRTFTFLPLKSAAHFTVTRGHFSKSLEECIHCVLCSVLTYLVGGLSLSVCLSKTFFFNPKTNPFIIFCTCVLLQDFWKSTIFMIFEVRNLHFLSKNSTLNSREKLSNCFGWKLVKILRFWTF